MNNKGQTLVLFVFLIPIVLIIFIFIISYGTISYEENKIKNNINYSIKYSLELKKKNKVVEDENLTNNDLKSRIEYIINKNISDYNFLNVFVNDDFIKVEISKNIKSNNENINSFNYCAKGYILDDKVKIGEC